MIKKHKIMGYIGGGLMLVIGIIILIFGITAVIPNPKTNTYYDSEGNTVLVTYETKTDTYYDSEGNIALINYEGMATAHVVGYIIIGFSSICLLAGLLGTIGTLLLGRQNKAANKLMSTGCIISLFTIVGFVSFVLLLKASYNITEDKKTEIEA